MHTSENKNFLSIAFGGRASTAASDLAAVGSRVAGKGATPAAAAAAASVPDMMQTIEQRDNLGEVAGRHNRLSKTWHNNLSRCKTMHNPTISSLAHQHNAE
jgi:hypothetical protein